MKPSWLLLILILTGWYYFAYSIFIQKSPIVGDSPELRSRFGTILWHSSDKNGRTGEAVYDAHSTSHTYCYYPKGTTQYSNKSGEYIIKREDSDDCSGWYGQAIFHEGSWVSEREKIWWNKEQKNLEDLALKSQKDNNI